MSVELFNGGSYSWEYLIDKHFHQKEYDISLNPLTIFRLSCIHYVLDGVLKKTFKFVLQQPDARLNLTEDSIYCIINRQVEVIK